MFKKIIAVLIYRILLAVPHKLRIFLSDFPVRIFRRSRERIASGGNPGGTRWRGCCDAVWPGRRGRSVYGGGEVGARGRAFFTPPYQRSTPIDEQRSFRFRSSSACACAGRSASLPVTRRNQQQSAGGYRPRRLS